MAVNPLMVRDAPSPRSQAAARRRAARRQRKLPILTDSVHRVRLPSMALSPTAANQLPLTIEEAAVVAPRPEDAVADAQARLKQMIGEEAVGPPVEMVEGMEQLLSMHTTQELSSLCGALGLRHNDTTADKLRAIREWLTDEQRFATALRFMWEGTLNEYLRVEGLGLKHARIEPRGHVLKYWRRGKEAPQALWQPLYVPRTERPKAMDMGRDSRIMSFLSSLREHERLAKRTEHSIRENWDFHNVLNFFAAMAALRKVEKDGREYLVDKLETTQARLHHTTENLTVTTAQERYMFVTKRDVHVGAGQLALDDELFDDLYATEFERRALETWAVDEVGALNAQVAQLTQERDTARAERAAALQELGRTQQALAAQTARADDLQEQLAAMTGKFDDLAERFVRQGAAEDVERELYFELSSVAQRDIEAAEERHATLNPMLFGMLESDLDREVEQARQIIETLQILNHELLVEHEELIGMRREELAQRLQEGVALAQQMMAARKARRNALVPEALPDLKKARGGGRGSPKKGGKGKKKGGKASKTAKKKK